MKVLFLCTGNYYRSRLAEEFLRAMARGKALDIICDSAALGIVPNPINVGPIRRELRDFMKQRNIYSSSAERFPRKCTAGDIESSDIVIGMNEPEHRHMVEKQFPGCLADKVRYWDVPDMEEDPGFIGPGLIEKNVEKLLKEIALIKCTEECKS